MTWEVKPLGDLCRIEIGGTPPRSSARYWDQGKATNNVWLSIADMPKTLHANIVNSAEHLSDEGAARVKIVKAGTLLVSFKLTLGRLAYAGKDLRTNEAIAALKLLDESKLMKEYLYWYLTFFDWDKAAEGEDKIKGKALNKAKLAVLPVLVPPLSEQHRIVAILDKAFAGIATAKANAEKNLRNADEVFKNELDHIFSDDGASWTKITFDELLEDSLIGLTRNSREQGHGRQYPYVKMHNITAGNQFDFSVTTNVDASEVEVQRFALKSGDFLFNTRNSHELVGKSCVYAGKGGVVLFNNNIMRVRFKAGIDSRFVLAAFSSRAVSDGIESLKSGTTNVSAIYYKNLRSLKIPMPSHQEQKHVVTRIDTLRDETSRLQSIYTRKLAALDELKQSLLQRAFSGQL